MSDFSGELCVVATALVSPLAVTPAAHAFFAAAGAAPAAASQGGPMKGSFACPWIAEDASPGARLGVLAAQAIAALLDGLPEAARTRVNIDVVVAVPGAGQGITEDDVWLVERSARTAAHGARTAAFGVVCGPRAWLDELLRAGRGLPQDSIRLLVAVDSLVAPERLAHLTDGQDSPWDAAPPRRSEAAAGVALATPAGAAEMKVPVVGRIRGAASRRDEAAPDNDAQSDGSALSEAIAALPGRSVFGMVVGPQSVSGFHRDELAMAVVRNVDRFLHAYRPLCPAALLGDVGLSALPAGLALALATLRHGTGTRAAARAGAASGALPSGPPAPEQMGPALAWDLLADGTRLALSLAASSEPAPAHVAARALVEMASPEGAELRFVASMAETRQGCLERLLGLSRLRKRAPWRELHDIERRILANLDALAEAGAPHDEVAAFCGKRGDPSGGFVAALVLGALAGKGVDRAALLEDTLVGLFGPEASVLVDEGARSLDPLWLTAEGMFLSPSPVARSALERWLDDGPPVLAAAAVVALARNKALSVERAERRARGGEPLFAAALARVGPLAPEVGAARGAAVRALLEAAGPLSWEAARGLLLAGDDTALARVRAGDALSDRLGERALTLLALGGHAADAPLFARLARRLPRTENTLHDTGMFGDVSQAPMLLDALEDEGLAGAAEKALETMLGPAPERAGGGSRAVWARALERAAWARGVRARDGKPWSVDGIATSPRAEELSDLDWQARVDELRLHGKRPIPVEPGGFGQGARAAFIAALGTERSAR